MLKVNKPNKPNKLDLKALEDGFQILVDIDFDRFDNFVNGEDDIITADMFLQCCIYDEVVYTRLM